MKTVVVSTVLLRKGFFLSMFLFLQKEKQISKHWRKKKCFYGSPLKKAANMKPFELAGSTSVKIHPSVKDAGPKGLYPHFLFCPYSDHGAASPAEKRKLKKPTIFARTFRRGQCIIAPLGGSELQPQNQPSTAYLHPATPQGRETAFPS